jgi:hypothetical protein
MLSEVVVTGPAPSSLRFDFTITSPAMVASFATIVTVIGLILSRIVIRKLRLTVHYAIFVGGSHRGQECYFVNVTNLSHSREVEITHVWFELTEEIPVLRPERPLPKRLKADETWETWIEVSHLPTGLNDERTIFRSARVRLSNGTVVRSKHNKHVPSFGVVPGAG